MRALGACSFCYYYYCFRVRGWGRKNFYFFKNFLLTKSKSKYYVQYVFCFRNIYFYNSLIYSYIIQYVQYLLLYYLYKYLLANTYAQRTKRSYAFVRQHKHTKPTNIIMFICLCTYTAAAAHAYMVRFPDNIIRRAIYVLRMRRYNKITTMTGFLVHRSVVDPLNLSRVS